MEIQNPCIPEENKALQEAGITVSVQKPQSCSSDQCFMFKVFRNILDFARRRARSSKQEGKLRGWQSRSEWQKELGHRLPTRGTGSIIESQQNPSSSLNPQFSKTSAFRKNLRDAIYLITHSSINFGQLFQRALLK